MAKKPLSLDGVVVDIGNSDYKYALVEQQNIGSTCRTKTLPHLSRFNVPVVGLCVVPKRQRQFEKTVAVRWINNEDVPIEAPKNIGIDRLVALYAANHLYKALAVAVIDVGTFLTVSVLRDSVFEGGYIVPGPHTMMTAYGAGAMLPANLRWGSSTEHEVLPQNTSAAMQAGTTLTLQGGLEMMIGDIRKKNPDILIVGTGGAWALLEPLDFVQIINPTLVLEGLAYLAKVKGFF